MVNRSTIWKTVARSASTSAVVIGVILLILTTAIFVVTSTNANVAAVSRELHRLDELQRFIEADRSFLATATHFNALRDRLEWDLDDEIQVVLLQSENAEVEVARLLDQQTSVSTPSVEDFLKESAGVRNAIEDGEVERASTLLESDLVPAFDEASADVSALRNDHLDKLVAIDGRGARFGDVARFVVVLLVPLTVVLVYREIVQRQLRSRRLEMQLEAEQELAVARDEFVANASHELRTPLTGILGLSEVLVTDSRVPEDVSEMLRMVTTEASDLARMVEDLLTTARLSAGQLRYEPRRVSSLEEAEVVIRPFSQTGKHIDISVEDGAVFVDRLRQRQVLRNLISNAVKYGGDHISLRGEVDGLWFRWTVADNGDGVPEELERRLFQRFVHSLTFQQAVAGGVGLGLSIVKSLTDGMGGSVEYSRFDGETRFIVRVPIADGLPGSRASIHATGGVR